MKREFNYDIMQEIKERWSPRAFSSEKISWEEIMAVLEAARYAPSCFNEQPWRFIIADDEESHGKMRNILAEANQVWANAAPVLIAILGKKAFEYNGKDNFWHLFDSGTAWGYLSLEAQRRGLATHAMGGFSKKGLKEAFNISDDYDVIAVVALGRPGDKEKLPQALQEKEEPASRKSLQDLILPNK